MEEDKPRPFRRVLANSGWNFFEKVVRLSLSFIVGVWFARYLGPEAFGKYNYAVAILAMLSVLSTLGIDRILLKDLADERDRHRKLQNAILLRIIGSIFTIIICCSLAFFLIIFLSDTELGYLLLLLSTSYLFQSLTSIEVFFQLKLSLKTVAYVKIGALASSACLKVILILLDSSLVYFALCVIVESAFIALGLCYSYLKYTKESLKFSLDLKYIIQLLAESWPLALSTLSGIIYVQMDKLMLGSQYDMTSVGVYAVYLQLLILPRLVFSSLNMSFSPLLIKIHDKPDQFDKRIVQMLSLNTSIGILLVVPLVIMGDRIVYWLFGDEYVYHNNFLIVLLGATLLVQIPNTLRTDFAILRNQSKLVLKLRLASVMINAMLNYLLIPYFGLIGAVVATFITVLFYDCISNMLFDPLKKYSSYYLEALWKAFFFREVVRHLYR